MATRNGKYVSNLIQLYAGFFIACFFLNTGGDCLLVQNQKIEIHWRNNNRDYYESKGYLFTNYKDTIMVNAEDLPESSSKRVEFVCDDCGKINKTSYNHYVESIKRYGKNLCHSCAMKEWGKSTLETRQEKHYQKLLDKCKENGYTLATKKDELKRNTTRIKYICPKHGEQEMRLANFLNGRKCPECNYDQHRTDYQLSQDEIIKRVKECNGKLLNPEDYINNSVNNLKFECSNCGEVFYSSLQHFLQHGGRLCKACSKTKSVGEARIQSFLDNHNICYEPEKWFPDCRDIKPLPFDFYLPDYNMMIEFDGEQHFRNKGYFKHSVEQINAHDEIKNNYCKEKGITMLRIPYTKLNNAESILTEKLLT